MSDVINKKQRIMLEWLVSDKASLSRCLKILKPSYFEEPLDRVVSFIVSYFKEHYGCPHVDLIEAETGVVFKERFMDESERSYLLEEIEEHCRQQAMIEAVMASPDLIESGEVNKVQTLVREALLVKLDNSIGTDLFDSPEERITTMAESVDEREIGLDPVDVLIGKIRRGELGLVYAGTSVGKSITLANIAERMSAQKLDVVICSFELGELLYAKRMDSIVTGYDIAHHTQNAKPIEDYLENIQPDVGSIILKRLRSRGTVEDVRQYLMEYHLERGKMPDVLICDYLALMGTEQKHGNKFDEHEEIAHGLRDLGDEHGMYVFSAGQINREGVDVVNITPYHCAGGLSTVMASDWAIALTASEEDIENSQVQASQLKVRNNGKSKSKTTIYICPRTLKMSGKPGSQVKAVPVNSIKPANNPLVKTKSEPEVSGKEKLKSALKLLGKI